MNAVERKAKRKLRLIVIRKIEVIEANNCLICPNRSKNDFECCKTCPIPSQLNELGKQLIAVTHRDEEPEKVVDPEQVKKRAIINERRRSKKKLPFTRKKKLGTPHLVFTADDYIRAVAGGELKSEITRRVGIPPTTLYNRTVKWGLTRLTRDQAIELLKAKEEVTA